MSTEVVMPQMGESIAEGTITKWLKKVGEHVDRDEPLFEISTDKVDAEIPSPAAGTLTEVRYKEGDTVEVNTVVAVLDGNQSGSVSSVSEPAPPPAPPPAPVETKPTPPPPPPPPPVVETKPEPTAADLRKTKSSPLVRKIAKEHNVDISRLEGTGMSGRVTKNDILSFIESGTSATPAAQPPAQEAPRLTPEQLKHALGPAVDETPAPPPLKPQVGDRVEAMSVMRKKIAEHMVLSAHTSPHVYSVYEVNFARVAALRDSHKAQYESAGARLTFTAFIAKVIIDALRQFPVVNASIDGDNIVYKKDINLGIAVALENGLIVPVIRQADEKNLLGLTRAINDLSARARSKKLNPDEVQGGTFTITNPGTFGAAYGLPLINQPQVAILGVGVIEKRAVVIDDAIAIRPMCHVTLGYDHRLIDGADAGRFLSFVKERLEHFEEGWT
jgi:pyruvate dehydrogenase E2 component (dihydrolipoamide acetyltransferase)